MARIRGSLFIYVSLLAGVGSAAAAAPLVTSKVDDSVTTAITGERSTYLSIAKDQGVVSDSTPMTHAQIVLKRPPALQAAFDKLVNDQLDRKSASFHHWLTPADLKNYAPDAADVAKVVAWLQSHGLTVNKVSPSAMMIDVSGPASALSAAFHTSLHNVVLPNGEAHIANMTDLAIPAALAPVLRGATLSNFFPKPNYVKKSPNYTFPFDHLLLYAVVPADFATIYNLNPLFSGNNLYGAKIAGAGVTIAVVEQTLIRRFDWDTFRTTFGLSGYAGKLAYQLPGACDNPGFTGDEAEAAIDAEWSSAVAPDATIIEAACSGGTLGFVTDLSQKDRKGLAFRFIQEREDMFHVALVFGEYPADQFRSLFRQVHDAGAAVRGRRCPFHVATPFKPINGCGHRPAAQQDFLAKGADRHRPLMKKCF